MLGSGEQCRTTGTASLQALLVREGFGTHLSVFLTRETTGYAVWGSDPPEEVSNELVSPDDARMAV